jgi:hypothetical protein
MITYTIQDAVNAAKIRLQGRKVCIDFIKDRELTESITLSEVNTISDELYYDTIYWE